MCRRAIIYYIRMYVLSAKGRYITYVRTYLPHFVPSLIPRLSLSFSYSKSTRAQITALRNIEGEGEPGQVQNHAHQCPSQAMV